MSSTVWANSTILLGKSLWVAFTTLALTISSIEYGEQCYCANSITSGATAEKCDVDNLMLCPGNKYTYCGAGNVLNLYYSATL